MAPKLGKSSNAHWVIPYKLLVMNDFIAFFFLPSNEGTLYKNTTNP